MSVNSKGRWKPSVGLEVGDRVKHIVKDKFGFVEKVNGDTVTVNLGGESVVVDRAGVNYFPSPEQIEKGRRMIRRSWSDARLRREMGLPPYRGHDSRP